MSHQAVNWAIEQRAGGPSPKATLWSIANYANEDWCSWPSQQTIGAESEQSRDTVRRQVMHLEAAGLVRCIPMRYAGRRSGNFYILAPSPYFGKSLAEIEPLLPRGYTPIVPSDPVDSSESDLENDAAKCGPVLHDDALNDAANDALNDAALVRHQVNLRTLEPGTQLESVESRAREPLISAEAIKLADEIAAIAGLPDPQNWPPGWCGAAMRVDAFLREGYHPEILLIAAREVMAGRRGRDPPWSIEYFAKAFANARARQAKPLPVVQIQSEPEKVTVHGANRSGSITEAGERRIAQLEQDLADKRAERAAGTESREGPVRLPAGNPDVQMLAPRRREQP